MTLLIGLIRNRNRYRAAWNSSEGTHEWGAPFRDCNLLTNRWLWPFRISFTEHRIKWVQQERESGKERNVSIDWHFAELLPLHLLLPMWMSATMDWRRCLADVMGKSRDWLQICIPGLSSQISLQLRAQYHILPRHRFVVRNTRCLHLPLSRILLPAQFNATRISRRYSRDVRGLR